MVHAASIFERIIRPTDGTLSAELAAYLLELDFPPADHSRYEFLSIRAQEGSLTEDERAELDDLLTASEVLAIFQSKARMSLRRQNPAA